MKTKFIFMLFLAGILPFQAGSFIPTRHGAFSVYCGFRYFINILIIEKVILLI